MKKITVIAIETNVSSSIIVPLDIFYMSDWYWSKTGVNAKTPYFQVELVSMDKKPIRCQHNLTLQPVRSIDEVSDTDVILIPIIGGPIQNVLDTHRPLIDWLKLHYRRGTVITAVGTGVFLLAEAGLLDDKIATTHWYYVDKFRQMYPQIQLMPERLITEDGNVICSGGNSIYDLSLYMIEKYCGHELAVLASKFFVLDLGRMSQAPYTIFDFQLDHRDQEILKAQEWIRDHFAEDFSIDTIAEMINMSPRTFQRRFKKATGDSPLVYLQRFRVEMSKRMLEKGNRSIEEITFRIGYENSSSFRKVFKKYSGLSPAEYRKKF